MIATTRSSWWVATEAKSVAQRTLAAAMDIATVISADARSYLDPR